MYRKVVRGERGNCVKCGQDVGYNRKTVEGGPERLSPIMEGLQCQVRGQDWNQQTPYTVAPLTPKVEIPAITAVFTVIEDSEAWR